MSHWHGEFNEHSIGATIYAAWQYKFFLSFFSDYLTNESTRLELSANYPFLSFAKRLIKIIAEDPENEDFNKLCHGAYKEYTGAHQCSYNLARSLAEGYTFLVENVSPKMEDWEW